MLFLYYSIYEQPVVVSSARCSYPSHSGLSNAAGTLSQRAYLRSWDISTVAKHLQAEACPEGMIGVLGGQFPTTCQEIQQNTSLQPRPFACKIHFG